MKALLKLLYVLLAIMILVCLTGIFLPSQINIKSTIEIQALPNVVFDQVNTMERWEIWSPWKDVDSSMTYTFSGNRIGEGSVMNWTSSQSGNGKMKITNSENAKSIELALFFEEQGNAVVAWDFEPVANSTLCNWSFSKNNLSYIERYVMVLFQKQIQASMNRGLLNLKKYCEKIKHGRVGIVSEIGIPPRKMLIITDSVPQTEIVKKELEMNRLFAKYQEKKKVEIKEQPITIFYNLGKSELKKFAIAYQVEKDVPSWWKVRFKEFPATKAMVVDFYGDYQEKALAYDAIKQQIESSNKKSVGYYWEEYKTDTTVVKDTSMWHTRVFFPIQ